MAVYAIGDVQGCFTTLLALLDAVNFDRRRDQLWFAGDLVNRGPNSLEVLRFVKALEDRAITVLGNHELHMLTVAAGLTARKSQDTFTDVLVAPDRDPLLHWVRQRPLLYHDPAYSMLLVHAGLPPRWTLDMARSYAGEVEAALRSPQARPFLQRFAGNTVSQWQATLEPEVRLLYIANCLTRLRFCDAAGRLALSAKGPPGTQPAPYLPWFALPNRAHAGLEVIFGHWSTLGPCTQPGVYALDTGCVWGGPLTALCLETREYVSVPCCEAGVVQRRTS